MTNVSRIDFGNDVTVLVGKNERRFVAHQDILCRSSTFFQAACSGNWRESKEKLVRLPEQSSGAFSIYLHWCYTGIIDLWDGNENVTARIRANAQIRITPDPRIMRLSQSYVLGDMLGAPQLCNALIDSWFDLFAETRLAPSYEEVNFVAESLPETCPLSRLSIHQMAFGLKLESFRSTLDKFTPKVIKEIARVAVEEADNASHKRPKGRGRCFYHVHADSEKRCDS